MSVYAIGDVQGCYAELVELVERIDFVPARDRLWLVGDLVNRGPQSLEVLRYVRSLGSAANAVLGNHDLHLLAVAADAEETRRGTDTLDAILTASDRDELLEWLAARPLLHHDAQLNFTMVHAGLPPHWDLSLAQACAAEVEAALRDPRRRRELFAHMYGNQPDRWLDDLRGHERLRFIVNCFTRLRVCDGEGRLHLKYKGPLDAIPEGLFAWFRAPGARWRSTRMICGHWSALDYYDSRDDERVLAIDTGCVWGGRLCAVRLDRLAEPVFVPSRQPRELGD